MHNFDFPRLTLETGKREMDNIDCIICLSQARDPALCPRCSKLFCDACVRTYFNQNVPNYGCPHCRATVGIQDFVRINWLQDLLSGISHIKRMDGCSTHRPKPLSLYCLDCKRSCCLECSKEDHQDHKLEALELTHDRLKVSFPFERATLY